MSDVRQLYQEVILDHNKRPRNFLKLQGANRIALGHNPLCGDKFTVYLRVADNRIEELSFEGSGCAISKASASLMTTVIKGRTKEEAEAFADKVRELVTGVNLEASEVEKLGKLAVFSGVSEFPARVKCANLAWRTLRAALASKDEVVSTE